MRLPETTEETLSYFHGEILALRRISAIALACSLHPLRGTPQHEMLRKKLDDLPRALAASSLPVTENAEFVRLGFGAVIDHLQEFLDV